MATIIFTGSAVPVAQVSTIALTDTWESGDKIHVDFGSVRWTYTTASATKSTIATAFASAWNALSATTYPQFAEITAAGNGDNITLTADTAGRAFSCSVSTTEGDGSAADGQTIGLTVTTANAGPNDASSTDNYSTRTVPTTGDDLIFDGAVCNEDLLYNLDTMSGDTLASLKVINRYSGKIGLPERNTDHTTDYDECRPTFLTVGITSLDVDCASGRIKINGEAVQTAATVRSTGSSSESTVPAIQWLGSNASNTLTVIGGTVGVAILGGQTATVATLRQSGGTLTCGSGTTLTTIQKAGGTLTIESATTTLVNDGGDVTINGSGAHASITSAGGTCYYSTSGTLTAYIGYRTSLLSCDKRNVARTITNATFYDQAGFIDSNRTVTHTNPMTFYGDTIGTRVKARRSFTVTPT